MITRATVVPDTTAKAYGKAREEVIPMLHNVVAAAMERGRSNIAERTPVGATGALRGGWSSETRRFGNRIVGTIINPMMYADIRDQGRRPGRRPPTSALMPWVGSKLGIPPGPDRAAVAYLVARKIGRSGYEGAHMVEDGWEATTPHLERDLEKLGFKLVRLLSQ